MYVGTHKLQMVKASVVVQDGVIDVLTDPKLKKCHLRSRGFGHDTESRETVRDVLQKHMDKLGLFSDHRVLELSDATIATGASETLADSLRNGILDCAVTVCDGAGTVVSTNPLVVQAIGAVIPWLSETTPIRSTQEGLRERGCLLLDDDGTIDQKRGVELAAAQGFRRIGVTMVGIESATASRLHEVEERTGTELTILVVHNSEMTEDDCFTLLGAGADMIWGCASGAARRLIGPKAIFQMQGPVPLFVMTQRGKRCALARLLHYGDPVLAARAALPVLPPEIQPEPML